MSTLQLSLAIIGGLVLALIVAVARAETALLLGDWEGVAAAVAAADALAAATGDHAHADRLAACRLALGALAGGAGADGASSRGRAFPRPARARAGCRCRDPLPGSARR